MFGFVSCSYINYMALVSFYQSFQISFFSLYLTTFPFIPFYSVGFTPFLFACLQQIVPVAFPGGQEGFSGVDLVPQVLRSPFQLKPEFSSSPQSAVRHIFQETEFVPLAGCKNRARLLPWHFLCSFLHPSHLANLIEFYQEKKISTF